MQTWRTMWQRFLAGSASRKLVLFGIVLLTAGVGSAVSLGLAAGGKKPAKIRNADKPNRKSTDAKNVSNSTDNKAPELSKPVADNHPLKPLIKEAEESLAALKSVKDYSTRLYKTELVNGKVVEQTMFMKLRHEPFSVYLKFETLHAGREVIFVEGQNKGKLLAHETGFKALAGTLAYSPTSKEVLVDNRYPITQAGMVRLLESIIDQWKTEAQFQEVTVETYSSAEVGDRRCRMLEVIHPQSREHFKFHKTKLYLDVATRFPIRLEQYDWPDSEGEEPVLVEEYVYTDINTNLGLTDMDFDKSNKAYGY